MNAKQDIAIRAAGRDDATSIAGLLARLGYPTDPATVVARLGRLEATGMDQVFVAEERGAVVGLASVHVMPTLLHIDRPLARITALVVDEQRGGRGIGTSLVAAVEELARLIGCASVEVSSNKRRSGAHAFYEALGYERSHETFSKALDEPAAEPPNTPR